MLPDPHDQTIAAKATRVRDSFKLVSNVSDESIFLNHNQSLNLFNIFDILLKSDLFVMVSSIFGAVIVYILILKFKESYSRSDEIKKNEDIDLFILLKKAISLVHLFVVLTFLLWIFIDTDNESDKLFLGQYEQSYLNSLGYLTQLKEHTYSLHILFSHEEWFTSRCFQTRSGRTGNECVSSSNTILCSLISDSNAMTLAALSIVT